MYRVYSNVKSILRDATKIWQRWILRKPILCRVTDLKAALKVFRKGWNFLPLTSSIDVKFFIGTNFVLSRNPSQEFFNFLCALEHAREHVTVSHFGQRYFAPFSPQTLHNPSFRMDIFDNFFQFIKFLCGCQFWSSKRALIFFVLFWWKAMIYIQIYIMSSFFVKLFHN